MTPEGPRPRRDDGDIKRIFDKHRYFDRAASEQRQKRIVSKIEAWRNRTRAVRAAAWGAAAAAIGFLGFRFWRKRR